MKRETGGSLFQSRKISRGKWEIFSARHDLLHQRIERWRDSYITRPVRVTPFDVKAPLRIITPPRATLSLFFCGQASRTRFKGFKAASLFQRTSFSPSPYRRVRTRKRLIKRKKKPNICREREREREEGDFRINSNYRLEKKIDPLPAFSSLFSFSLPPLLFPFTAEIAADNAFHSRRAGENRNEKGNRVNYCAGIFSRWYSAPPRSQPFPRSSFSRPPPLDFSRLIIPSPPPFQASWTRLRRLSHPSAAFNRQRSRSKQRSVRVSAAGRGQERVRFIERSVLDHFPVHRD